MDASPPGTARSRRTLLILSIIAGLLTTGGTLAGNFVNIASGASAVTLALTGAVLAGSATVVVLVTPGPERVDAETSESAPRRRKPRPGRANAHLNPLEAIRGLRLHIAVLLAALTPLVLASGTLPPDWETLELGFLAKVTVVVVGAVSVTAMGVHLFTFVKDDEGVRQRGGGMDAVASYTAAAGLGFWQYELGEDLGRGMAVASFTLLAATLVTGLVEDDSYRYGPLPALLVAVPVGMTVHLGPPTIDGWDLTGPAAAATAIAVVLPAGLRGRHPGWPPGLVEFVPLAGGAVLALYAGTEWIAPTVAVFLAALVYSWRYPQSKIAVGEGNADINRLPWFVILPLSFCTGLAPVIVLMEVVQALR